MIFNGQRAKRFALIHLLVTICLIAYALIDWYYISPELRRVGGVPWPLLISGGLYFLADLPVTGLYAFYWSVMKLPRSMFDVWWMPAVVYAIFGTLWWHLLGGYWGQWKGLFKRRK